jgi:hypothetical protein
MDFSPSAAALESASLRVSGHGNRATGFFTHRTYDLILPLDCATSLLASLGDLLSPLTTSLPTQDELCYSRRRRNEP